MIDFDYATLLRPQNERNRLQRISAEFDTVDYARSFKCPDCVTGMKFAKSCVSLTNCQVCASTEFSEKLFKVEEHLLSYVQQLEEIIFETSETDVENLSLSVDLDPAGLSLLADDHFLALRLNLARAKFYKRIQNYDLALIYWRKFESSAQKFCSRIISS